MPKADDSPAVAPGQGTGAGGSAERLPDPRIGGLWGVALLAAIFAWWAWQDGAYFETVLLPGLIALCIGVLIIGRLSPAQLDPRHSPAAAIALGAFVLLGGWTLLSAVWGAAPETSIAEGQRALAYALCFGCGLWFCALLGRRSELSMLPFVVAAGFAAAITVVSLLTVSDPASLLNEDGTLDFPLGYRNANAAFFAAAIFPSLGLAADRTADWRLRGLSSGVATACFSLFLLTQSRASLPALVIGLVVFLLLSPLRVRAASWIVLALALGAATLPAAVSVFDVADGPIPETLDELRIAGWVTGVAALASIAIGALAGRLGRAIPGLGSSSGRHNGIVVVGMAVLAVLAAAAFVNQVGDPVEWVDDRVNEFENAGTPDLGDRGTRFGFNVGSGRYDLWRVALDEAGDAPLLGAGPGGFQYAYTRDRESPADVRDAHSVELELLSELGIPGLALLLIALAGATLGGLRSRRARPETAGLVAAALGAGTYWIVHSSVDWFWAYPAVTAPVLALLGAACAPAMLGGRTSGRGLWRIPLAVMVVLLALSAVPVFLAERYVNQAYAVARSDPDRAFEDLDRARSLNPLDDQPLLARGGIALELGDREAALGAFQEAADKRPEEWAAHFFVAQLSAGADPRLARAEIRTALQLNPGSEDVRRLAERIGVRPPPDPFEG